MRTALMLFLACALALSAQTAPKLRVAVVEFDEKNDIGTHNAGRVLPGLLIGHFKNIGKWELEERLYLKKVIDEQVLQEALLDRDAEAVEMGKLNGAQAIITGSTLRIGKVRILSARCIDVTTGEVLHAAHTRFDKDEDLEKAAEELAYRLSGYSAREHYTLVTARALRQPRLYAAAGTGWGHTRAEEWNLDPDGYASYHLAEETAAPGLALDFGYQSRRLDLGLYGIVPHHIGVLGASASYYPWTHIGAYLGGLWQISTVDQDDWQRGLMQATTGLVGLSLRPTSYLQFSLAKGYSTWGQVAQAENGTNATRTEIEPAFDILKGPTMAEVRYRFNDKYFILSRYFHDVEKSAIVTDMVAPSADGQAQPRQVLGVSRWFVVNIGANLGL